MRNELSPDWIIIGAGVSGLSLAEALLLDGCSVTVLEKNGVARESSWAGGGILSPLCPWDYSDEVTRLTNFSAAIFEEWSHSLFEATGIDPEYEKSGMLVMSPFLREAAYTWCRQHDMRYEDSGEAILLPDIAQVRNPRLMQALKRRVELLGGAIREHINVHSFAASGSRIVSVCTDEGDFSSGGVVVTAGAWSRLLLRDYASNIHIKPVRGQMLLFKFESPPIGHIFLRDGLYLIPRRDGHLLVGSTLEDVGFDKSTTEEARESLLRRAQVLLPQLEDQSLVQHWSGLRPASPGNIPVIGRHPELDNLYASCGHFRYGVTMAPASAEILRNMMFDRVQPFDVAAYLWK